MNQRGSKRSARIIVAAVLAFAFMCAFVPLAAVSAGDVCGLECCAGRAPHAAGSCMNGTCHAAIKNKSAKRRPQKHLVAVEEFCGLKPLSKRLGYRAISSDGLATRQTVAKLTRPCEPDCGGCAVGSVSAKGKIATTSTYRLPTGQTIRLHDADRITANEVSHCQHSPRGPPTTS